MAFNRDLSQLANFLEVNSDGTFVNIIPSTSQAQLGIGTNNPTAKLDVIGNARVSGNLSAGSINASGIVTATSGFVGNLTGLASSATKLETGRTVAITGDLAYTSGSFDGTGNVTGTGTLATVNPNVGSFGSQTLIPVVTVNAKGLVTSVTTAAVGSGLTVSGDSGSENIDLLTETLTISGGTNLTSSAASNAVTVNLDPNISLTSVVASGIITATSGFVGNVTGTATSTTNIPNLSGDITSANTVTTLATVNSNVGSFGSQTLIPVVTVNAKGLVTSVTTAAVGSGLTVSGDSGSENIDLLTETLTISGGTNLTSSAASNTVTVNLDPNISLTSIVASGIITATSGFVGNLTGLASSATKLETGRTVAITGDLTYTSGSFDGTGNVTGTGTLANTAVTPGSYGSSTEVATFTVDSKGRLTAAGTASVGTALTVTGDSGSENISLLTETLTISGGTNLTSSAASNTVTVNLDNNISLTSVVASGIITATSGFVGNLTGEVNAAAFDTNASGVIITGIATAGQFVTGDSGVAIGINTNTISGPATITIDPAAVGDNTGLVVIKGDLQIDGTTTTVNSTTITIDDKNLVLGSGAANDAAADGGGITLESGGGNKTFNWVDATDSWTSSEHINALTGKVYKINGTEVLSSTTIGSGVVNSSLTSVGTLTNLSVGNVNSSGIITATSGFVGNLTGNINSSGVSTVTNLNIGGYVSIGNTTGVANQILSSTGVGVSWKSFNDLLPQTRTGLTTSATASQTLFSFVYNVNFLDVFVNGVKLSSGEFTASNGTSITLSEGAFANDTVEFVSYSTLGAGTGQVSSLNDLTDVTLSGTTTGQLLAYNGSEFVNTSNINVTGIITAAQFVTGASGVAIGINTNTISGPATITIDPAAVGNDTGLVVIKGDLQIDGTTTTVNSTTMTVDDINITLASGAANAAAANGAGITIDGASATLLYASTGDKWVFNKDVEAVDFNSTSDINLKENIRQVESASELVSKLEGVHFSWKETGKETIGVIAQQIEEHLPQLVQTGDTHKTVNYNGLIGVLIEAVKEQGAQIAALQAEIATKSTKRKGK